MKRLLLLLVLVLPVFGFIGYRTVTAPSSTQLVVYVTSTNPEVPVSFEAAYLFKKGSSELKVVEATTPYTLREGSDVFSGIFRQTSGDAALSVKLVERNGEQERELALNEGAVVLLQEVEGRRSIAGF